MKRIISLLMALLFILALVACGEEKANIEYYDSTDIPTFTCVTGIKPSDNFYGEGMTMYIYNCKFSDVEKYVAFLIDLGYHKSNFADMDIDNNSGIILSKEGHGRVGIIPYYSFSEGEITITPIK